MTARKRYWRFSDGLAASYVWLSEALTVDLDANKHVIGIQYIESTGGGVMAEKIEITFEMPEVTVEPERWVVMAGEHWGWVKKGGDGKFLAEFPWGTSCTFESFDEAVADIRRLVIIGATRQQIVEAAQAWVASMAEGAVAEVTA